jgi:integrase
LRAALAWAVDQEVLAAVPKIRRPQRANKRGKVSKGKGRPITVEEFERMLAAVPKAVQTFKQKMHDRRYSGPTVATEPNAEAVESWRFYLRGLWLSGLRLRESLALSWDPDAPFAVDLSAKRPRFRISAEAEKGHQDRLLPLTPDFAEFLLAIPEAGRRGRVFRPMAAGGDVGRIVSLIGELAGVKVHVHPKSGKIKYASAHDLRRSFGTRWAKRVMPAVLQKFMRHESIQTTMGYYVDLDADELAEQVWKDHERRESGQEGTVLGTVGPRGAESEGR